MTTKIKATNIWKKFNNLEVLKGIDLEVNEGEVVAVIGPSGGGKSTLLRCLNKLETIDKGSITIDGEELCRETSGGTEYVKNNDVRRIACKMGMVFQQFNLFPHMDIMKNLTLAPMKLQGKSQQEAEAEAMRLLERVGLADRAHAYPSQLSGGQKQRLSIARAIAKDPEIFIFDDSFSALDFKTDSQLRKALKEHTKDATTIIVAQRISTILNADQIIVLDDGRMAGIGTHKELMADCEVYQQIARSQLSEEELA